MITDREARLLLEATSAGISSPKELANFMAQVSHESNGLASLEEGFQYTKGISQITNKVRSALREGPEALEEARIAALNGAPEKLAELMYGTRMGNDQPGDAFKYRGRGYIQLTGRSQYEEAEQALGFDFLTFPELAADPEYAGKIAIFYWNKHLHGSEAAEDLIQATRIINGGENGLSDRMARFEKWERVLTPSVVEKLAQGRLDLPVQPGDQTHHKQTAQLPPTQQLQEALNALGYTDVRGRGLQVDGHYGQHTREAVASFQRHQGLSEDGIAGPKTWAALQEAVRVASPALAMTPISEISTFPQRNMLLTPAAMMSPPMNPVTQPSPHTPSTALLPSALSGEAASPLLQGLPTIRDLQGHLTILGLTGPNGQPLSMTGRLDPDTRYATQNFQAAFGLDVTGIPDRATMDAAREHAASMAPQQQQENTPRQPSAYQEGMEDARATQTPRTTMQAPKAIWTSEPLPPPRVPTTFAEPDHPKHYRYQTLLEQVQEAPALQRYTADQHARIAAGLTFVSDQHKAFFFHDLRAIEVKGNDLVVTDHLKIGQESEVLHGNLSTMLARTPEETANAWREWALPKQPALATPSTAGIDPQPVSHTDVRHPQEPHHAMFLEARRKLGEVYAQHGMTRDPEQLDREAALVTVVLRERRFDDVPTLRLACESDGKFSTQPGLCAITEFDMVKLSGEALKQAPPVEQSSQTLVQVEQRLQEQAIALEQQRAQQAGMGRTR